MTPTSLQKTFYPHLATMVDTRLSIVNAELYSAFSNGSVEACGQGRSHIKFATGARLAHRYSR
jgi:hypothetical protein